MLRLRAFVPVFLLLALLAAPVSAGSLLERPRADAEAAIAAVLAFFGDLFDAAFFEPASPPPAPREGEDPGATLTNDSGPPGPTNEYGLEPDPLGGD